MGTMFKFERATETFVTSQPTLMDPLDHRNVYIAESGVNNSGEGMFARRAILAGEAVALYAGTLVLDEDALFRDNMTEAESDDAHKNLLSYDDHHSLNLPPKYVSIIAYRASLGHKASRSRYRLPVWSGGNFC